MALQSSGAISFRDLQQEYGGPANSNEGSISLSKYYAGASGNGTTTAKVPTSPAYSESLGAEINWNSSSNPMYGDTETRFRIVTSDSKTYYGSRIDQISSSRNPQWYGWATVTGTNSSVTDSSNYQLWNSAGGWSFNDGDNQVHQSQPFIVIVTLTASGSGNTNAGITISGSHAGSGDLYNSEGGTGGVVTGLNLSDGQTYTVNYFSDDSINFFGAIFTNESTSIKITNFQGTFKIRQVNFHTVRIQPASDSTGTTQKPILKQSRSSPTGAYTYGSRFVSNGTFDYHGNLGENDLDTSPGTFSATTLATTRHNFCVLPKKSDLPYGSGVDLYTNFEDYMPKTTIAQAQAGEDGGFIKWGTSHSVPSSGTVSMSNHYGGFQVAPVPTFIMPDGKQHGITLTQNGVATATATGVIV